MSDAVVTAAIARLVAAFPGWHNATGAAHPTPEAKLPAFALRVTYSDGERVAMGDPRMLREGQIEIGIEARTPVDDEAGLHDLAHQIGQAILAAPPDLGGAVWQITQGAFEAEHDKGESRISRGDLILPIEVLE
jgi:hypothetical protein